MPKDYKAITSDISEYLKKLREEAPKVMLAFGNLKKEAYAGTKLDDKTRELISIGIAIAGRCDGCIGFHTETLVKLGTTREEFIETLAIAIYMGGGPSLMFAADALRAFETFSQPK